MRICQVSGMLQPIPTTILWSKFLCSSHFTEEYQRGQKSIQGHTTSKWLGWKPEEEGRIPREGCKSGPGCLQNSEDTLRQISALHVWNPFSSGNRLWGVNINLWGTQTCREAASCPLNVHRTSKLHHSFVTIICNRFCRSFLRHYVLSPQLGIKP